MFQGLEERKKLLKQLKLVVAFENACNNIGLKWVNASNRKFATHQFDTPK